MRRCGPTPTLTIFVAYTPTSSCEEEEVKAFYTDLEKFCREDYAFYKVIIGDFNSKVLPLFIMTTETIVWNSQFQKPSSLRWTWKSPGGGYRNEIDHIIVSKRFCLTDGAVVPKFYTGSDHRLLQGRFPLQEEKRKPPSSESKVPELSLTGISSLR
ncbi:hypothetical protein RB195_001808 [Necator americanus]|uniref:Endonuclease/exonuclease/phosphatase domain-containing protein n=1 Tax=Necator americanus TaxID=51031 RepID=A0ABR1DG07_NECAM